MPPKPRPYADAIATHVVGEEAILRLLPELAAAAEGWGQGAEVMELPHSFSVPSLPRRTPVLLLYRDSAGISGAVVAFAYLSTFLGQRLLSNADRLGRRGIYGPSADRLRLAAAAASEWLRRGAALVNLDFLTEQIDGDEDIAAANFALLAHQPEILGLFELSGKSLAIDLFPRLRYVDLPLYPALEDTLSRLGKRTRRNVRAYRRQAELELGVTFHVPADITLAEFLEINRRSHHALSGRITEWRYAAAKGASGFLAGTKTAEGRWIALAGGRLAGATVVVDWQLNDLSFARYSVSLVMRGYLMEHFGAAGRHWLCFESGTAHVMATAFRKRIVVHLQARRPQLWLRLLTLLLRRFFPRHGITRSLFGPTSG